MFRLNCPTPVLIVNSYQNDVELSLATQSELNRLVLHLTRDRCVRFAAWRPWLRWVRTNPPPLRHGSSGRSIRRFNWVTSNWLSILEASLSDDVVSPSLIFLRRCCDLVVDLAAISFPSIGYDLISNGRSKSLVRGRGLVSPVDWIGCL